MTSEFKLQEQLLRRLAEAGEVMVLTGAGMSAESGIPTFREAQTGLWSKYRPEELATPEAFEANPARVWKWYDERRQKVAAARPNDGHRALADLEKLVSGVRIVTQNVDGLHQLAGSTHVLELHGNIQRFKCSVTHRPISTEWLADATRVPPPSPYVRHGMARPDVVWFGEALSQETIDAAMAAAIRCSFCFSIGTTALVQPAASLPMLALENGAALVEINPVETPLSLHADQCLRGPAAVVLTSVITQLRAWLHDTGQKPGS
jgi:NAD-dependent deacetylase